MRGGVVLIAALLIGAGATRADIYTYTDADGVIHFTNIDPPSSEKHEWKTLYKTGPSGKSSAERCKDCDRVPASDFSNDRYVRYDAYIREAADLYQIPEPLIRAIILVESDYDLHVVSSVGAMGLMQLMPENCKDDHVEDPFDPRDNILGGTRQLRVLANRYEGDLVLTVAAFNAGPGAVAKYGGVPPYAATEEYVRRVLKAYYRYRDKVAKPKP